LVHVFSQHPIYDFQVGELVALVSGNSDPFWLAEISMLSEENLDLIYGISSNLSLSLKTYII
jgi:hypothetical protein